MPETPRGSTGSEPKVLGVKVGRFNRVELVVREDEIEDAVKQFNELLGLHLPRPHAIAGVPVLSATDFDGFIEFVAPINGEGPFGSKLGRTRSGPDRSVGVGDR